MTFDLTQKAIEKANERFGLNIGNVVHATGGWQRFTNPSTVQQAIASKEGAQAAANYIGYILQQTEVWVNSAKAMTKNPKAFAVDVVEVGSKNIRDDARLSELWEKIVSSDETGLIQGYQPIELEDGSVGIRILVDKGGKKAREAVDALDAKMDDIVADLDYDVSLSTSEAEIYKARNDWTENPDGKDYLSAIDNGRQGSAENQGRSGFDLDREELEEEFGRLIKERSGETSTIGTPPPKNGGV